MNAPIRPRITSIMIPKPRPRISFPASHPAMSPIMIAPKRCGRIFLSRFVVRRQCAPDFEQRGILKGRYVEIGRASLAQWKLMRPAFVPGAWGSLFLLHCRAATLERAGATLGDDHL